MQIFDPTLWRDLVKLLKQLMRFYDFVLNISREAIGESAAFLYAKASRGKGQDASEKDLEALLLIWLSAIELKIQSQVQIAGGRCDLLTSFVRHAFPMKIKAEAVDVSRWDAT